MAYLWRYLTKSDYKNFVTKHPSSYFILIKEHETHDKSTSDKVISTPESSACLDYSWLYLYSYEFWFLRAWLSSGNGGQQALSSKNCSG